MTVTDLNLGPSQSLGGPHEVARAAGAVNTLNRVGGSLGTAVLAVVLQRSPEGVRMNLRVTR